MFDVIFRVVLLDNLYELNTPIKFLPRVFDTITYAHSKGTICLEVQDVNYEDDGGSIRIGLVPRDSTMETFSEEELVTALKASEYKDEAEKKHAKSSSSKTKSANS